MLFASLIISRFRIHAFRITRHLASGDGGFFEDGGGRPPCAALRPLSFGPHCNIRQNASPEIGYLASRFLPQSL